VSKPGQLAARLAGPLRDQREDDPLHRLPVQPPASGRGPDRGADTQSLPDPVQRPHAAQPAGVQHLHLGPACGGDRGGRIEEPGDRGHQLASTLRSLGQHEEAVDLLTAELARDSDDLDDAVRAFLALALTSAGRERDAVSVALTGLAAHLTRYNRSLAAAP
jgi:Tetratrico peptide repeat